MSSISERESGEVEAANASGATPVVFIHGLWLLPSSWSSWADFFQQAGYAPLTPDWPDDPETIEAARAEPEVLRLPHRGSVEDQPKQLSTINRNNTGPAWAPWGSNPQPAD